MKGLVFHGVTIEANTHCSKVQKQNTMWDALTPSICCVAQTTPPTTHKIRTIRRQSSIGAYHDHPPSHPPPTSHSVPATGSVGYFTNSPSPPTTIHDTQPTSTAPHTSTAQSHHQTTSAHDTRQHEPAATAAERHQAGGASDPRQHESSATAPLGYISQIEQNLASVGLDSATGDATALHSKTVPDSSDILVISRNQFDGLNQRLDQLSRRVLSLENSLASDIRLILQLVQGKEPAAVTSCLTSKPIKEVSPQFVLSRRLLNKFYSLV